MKAIITTSTDLDKFPIFEPAQISNNFDYYIYTNSMNIYNVCKNKNWRIIVDINKDIDNKKQSRLIKIKTHIFLPNYDSYLYIDSKFTHIPFNIDAWFDEQKLKDYDLVLMRHPKRNCVYSEGRAIISAQLDTMKIINKQLDQYKSEGMPERYGLWAPGICFKKNTTAVNEFMELWWKEIQKYSHRDIPSFSYCKWKYADLFNQIKFKDIDFRETTKLFYGNF